MPIYDIGMSLTITTYYPSGYALVDYFYTENDTWYVGIDYDTLPCTNREQGDNNMQLKKKLIPVSKPLNDIYEQREEIGNEELYSLITLEKEILIQFHVEDIPNLDEKYLNMFFLRSIRDAGKKQTFLFVQ